MNKTPQDTAEPGGDGLLAHGPWFALLISGLSPTGLLWQESWSVCESAYGRPRHYFGIIRFAGCLAGADFERCIRGATPICRSPVLERRSFPIQGASCGARSVSWRGLDPCLDAFPPTTGPVHCNSQISITL